MIAGKKIYTAFGLTIVSDIELPEFFTIVKEAEDKSDIEIILGQVPVQLERPLKKNPWYEVAKGEFLLRVEGIAQFYVKNGDTIIIEPHPEVKEEDIRIFLLNTVFSQLLYQRGYSVLHGGAVMIDDQAVLFLGKSGVGKTSLAFTLSERGYHLFGDELCVITMEDGKAKIVPGIPQLNIWKDTLLKSGKDVSRYKTIRQGIHKYAYDVQHRFCRDEVEISSVVFLKGHNRDEIERESYHGVQKFDKMMRSIYNIEMSEFGGQKENNFKNCMTIAGSSNMLEVSFNNRIHDFNMVADFMLKELKKNERADLVSVLS